MTAPIALPADDPPPPDPELQKMTAERDEAARLLVVARRDIETVRTRCLEAEAHLLAMLETATRSPQTDYISARWGATAHLAAHGIEVRRPAEVAEPDLPRKVFRPVGLTTAEREKEHG